MASSRRVTKKEYSSLCSIYDDAPRSAKRFLYRMLAHANKSLLMNDVKKKRKDARKNRINP